MAASPPRRRNLKLIGIKPAGAATGRDGAVSLNDLEDVAYRVEAETQRIYIIADDKARQPKRVDLDPHSGRERPKPQSSTGAIFNYSLFSSTNNLLDHDVKPFQGISGGFDARLFSPFGTINQSFTASLSNGELQGVKRLNTTWSYSDPERLVSYGAGDVITGGLAWTRPVYLGGMQIQRNFALRSDLVTLPMPLVSGSAAVPSTLEVYTGNVKTYSGEVPAGPFELANFPVITGAGEAQIVVRDTLGRETRTTLPFYTSSEQLRRGLFDFSVDIGFPRRNYGVESNDYSSDSFWHRNDAIRPCRLADTGRTCGGRSGFAEWRRGYCLSDRTLGFHVSGCRRKPARGGKRPVVKRCAGTELQFLPGLWTPAANIRLI
jgi:outer membrane usher protein